MKVYDYARTGRCFRHEPRRHAAGVKMHDCRMHLAQRSRESHGARDIRASALPVDRTDADALVSQGIANGSVVAKENYGKPVTMGVQRGCEIEDSEGNTARVLLAAPEHVYHVD
jgi:hypothetical protein